MAKLNQIEGIGLKYTLLLQEQAIEDQDQLLQRCGTRKQREQLAEQTGICVKLILKWTKQADLGRIKGIGFEFAELLEQSEIDSVTLLAQFEANQLSEHLKTANDKVRLVKHMPGTSQLNSWIEQAKTLAPAVFY